MTAVKTKQNKRQYLDQRGQTLIEYLIIVAIMGIASMSIMRFMGKTVSLKFAEVSSAIQGRPYTAEKEELPKEALRKKDLGNFMKDAASPGDR